MSLSKYFSASVLLICLIVSICAAKIIKRQIRINRILQLKTIRHIKTLTTASGNFPKMPLLYLRRAIRLTQENAHELAYADFQKAWTLSRDWKLRLPFAANLEILGKHQERLSLLEYPEPRVSLAMPRLADCWLKPMRVPADPGQALTLYNNMIAKDSSGSGNFL